MAKLYTAEFAPGMIVRHRQFGYLGVIYDVDPIYSQSPEWYDMMSNSTPSKMNPWYHVLVDGETHTTYVAEENLICSEEEDSIEHPLLSDLFVPAETNSYQMRQSFN